MTSTEISAVSLPSTRRCVLREFWAWLARANSGEQFEYHRGHLIWDRSSASDLAEHERQAVAEVADTALQAAEAGFVHLVQRRNGPFDFSYLATKAGCRARAVPAASPPQLSVAV